MVLSLDGSNRLWTLRPTERIELSCQGPCTDLFHSVHFDVARMGESCNTTCHFFSFVLIVVVRVYLPRLRWVVERSPIKMEKYYEKQTSRPHQERLVRSWHWIFARQSLCIAKIRQTTRTFFFEELLPRRWTMKQFCAWCAATATAVRTNSSSL